MATKYVWSGATGAGNGTSWADAFTSVGASLLNPAQGDRILVASDHSEIMAANIGDQNTFAHFISVDRATDQYQAGAAIVTAGRDFVGGIWRAFTISVTGATGDIGNAYPIWLVDCTITFDGSYFDPGTYPPFTLINCTLAIGSGAGQAFYNTNTLELLGCTISGTFSSGALLYCINTAQFRLRGCDLSAVGNAALVAHVNDEFTKCDVFGCAIPSGFAIGNPSWQEAPDEWMVACLDAVPAGMPLQMQCVTERWRVDLDTSVYRDAGAVQDGVNFSWHFTPNGTHPGAGNLAWNRPSPPIRTWVAGGSAITLAVHLIHDGQGDGTGGRLTEEEVTLEVLGPPESGAARHYSHMGWVEDLTTPADHPDSTEDWTGAAGATVKQKVTHTYTPAESGWLEVRLWITNAARDRDLYVCPRIEIS